MLNGCVTNVYSPRNWVSAMYAPTRHRMAVALHDRSNSDGEAALSCMMYSTLQKRAHQ